MPVEEHLDIPRRRPLGGIIAAVLAAVLILAAGGAGLALVRRGGQTVAPELRGLSLQVAADTAEKAGVGLLVRGNGTTETALVVTQEPAPGAEMRSGDVVWVELAEPPTSVIVPDTTGLTSEEARALLESLGLRPGALREDLDSAAPPGVVTRQEPTAGMELPAGASVSLWVAGAPSVLLPDLSGLTRQEAEATAAAAGLTIRFLAEITDEVLPGLVFKQSPRAGARVAPSSQIVAVVNGGSPGSTATVPGGTGAGAGEAPPAVFVALARSYPFPILYPTQLPPDLELRPTPDNPGHRTGAAGAQGFEVAYTAAGDPLRTLSLLEGDWFDPGLEGATTVDVRGLAANLVVEGDVVILDWSEHGTSYALSANRIPASDVLAVATALRAVTAQ